MSGKRANGEGSVYEDRANGRWVGEVVLDSKRRRVSASTKAAAAAKLREMIRKHEGGGIVVDGHASLRSLVELWQRVELPSRQMAPNTRTRFEWHCRIIVEHLGDARLRSLSADRVEAMYAALVKGGAGRKPFGRATLVSLRSTLSQVLRFGQRRGILDRNIAPITVIPGDAARETRRSSLTVEQAHRLWDVAASHRLGAMWRVGMFTGLRPGELAGLLWSAVDLDGETPSITISRNVQLVKGRPVLVESVKTDGSYRTIALPPMLVPVMREHRSAQLAERLASTRWGNADLVFASSTGEALNPSNVRRDLTRFCVEHDVEPVSPNELRHTAASIMLDAGMTLEQVAAVLGHSSTRMLEKHYRHRLRPVVDNHVGAMSRVFDGWSA